MGGPAVAHHDVVDADHLRRILEQQPSCVIRVALDGLLLAVNDVGLGLLGVAGLGDVLEHNLTEFLTATGPEWRDFSDRVWAQGSASMESGLGSAERTVLLNAVALRDHPDGIDSLILSMRETSLARKLELSLESERVAREDLAGLHAQMEQSAADRQQLVAALEQRERDLAKLRHIFEAQQTALLEHEKHEAEAVAERQRLHATVQGFEEERRRLEDLCATTRAELAAVTADAQRAIAEAGRHADEVATLSARLAVAANEREQFEAALANRDGERARIEREHAAERARLEAELAAAVAQRPHDTSAAPRVAELETELANARSLINQVAASHAADVKRHAAARTEAEAALALERLEKSQREEQHRHALADLEAQLTAARIERDGFAVLIDERDAALQQQIASRTALEQAVARVEGQLETAHAEQDRLIGLVRDRDAALQEEAAARAALAEAITRVETELKTAEIEQGRLIDLLRDRDAALATHAEVQSEARTRLEEIAAERDQMKARCDLLEQRLGDVEARGDASRAALDEAVAQRDDATARCERLEQRVRDAESQMAGGSAALDEARRQRDEADAECHRLEQRVREADAQIAAARIALDEAMAQRADAAAQGDRLEESVRDLEARLAAALLEQTQLGVVLESRNAELHRALASRAAAERALAQEREEHERRDEQTRGDVADIERRLTAADAERARIAEQLIASDEARDRFVAECDRLRAEMEALRGGHADAVARQAEHQNAIATMQAELALAVAERTRAETIAAQAERDRQHLAAAHAAERAEAQRLLGEGALENRALIKTLVDVRFELQQLQSFVRELEPLAASGRIAATLASDFREAAAAIDGRARSLLQLSSLEEAFRPEVEALHAEAVRALSLARMFAARPVPASAADAGRPAAATGNRQAEEG